MFKIVNDGQAVTETDYWDDERARLGLCFLSWNAGAARLLVPDAARAALTEAGAASCVIVSRGPLQASGLDGVDALELLFEDHSPAPLVLIMASEQCDRQLGADAQGRGFPFIAYGREGELLRMQARFRSVARIPWAKPWAA